MNRILPAALLLALSSGIAFAQQAPAPVERPQAGQQSTAQMSPRQHRAHNPEKQAAHLSKALNLTSDQQSKLAPILADRQQRIAALQADANLDPKSRHKQMRTIRTSTEQQMATFLSADQMQQMKSMRHGGGHGRKSGNRPLSPTPTT